MADEIIRLNAGWRIADDPPQWSLQCRSRTARERTSGWVGRKFVRDRDHLLRRIRELCGDVDAEAIEVIKSWPQGYVTWKLQEMHPCAGHKTGPQGAISESGVSKTHSTIRPP